MVNWLLKEEAPIKKSISDSSVSKPIRSEQPYSILLRKIHVVDNKRLFFSTDLVIYSIIIDGFPDMRSGNPFWVQELKFSDVDDNTTLSIDPETGFLIYYGKPSGFLNLYILTVRDSSSIREFAKVLKDNFVAKGIGMIAGAAISIFAGQNQTIGSITPTLAAGAVDLTIDYFINKGNKIIGVYYGSLLREDEYGNGFHPSSYPPELLDCGKVLGIAYEVRKGEQ